MYCGPLDTNKALFPVASIRWVNIQQRLHWVTSYKVHWVILGLGTWSSGRVTTAGGTRAWGHRIQSTSDTLSCWVFGTSCRPRWVLGIMWNIVQVHIAIVSCNMVCHSHKTYLQVDSLNKELDTKRARDSQPGNDNFDFYCELSGRQTWFACFHQIFLQECEVRWRV